MKLDEYGIVEVFCEIPTLIYEENSISHDKLKLFRRRDQIMGLCRELEKLCEAESEAIMISESKDIKFQFNGITHHRMKINLISDDVLKELLRLAHYGEKYLSEQNLNIREEKE